MLCGIRSWELESRTLDLLSVYDENEVCELMKLGVLFVGVVGVVGVEGEGDDEGWEYGEGDDEGCDEYVEGDEGGVVVGGDVGDEINIDEI